MTRSRTTRLLTAPIIALVLALGATAPAYSSSTKKKDPKNDFVITSNDNGVDLASVELKTLNRKSRIRVTFRLHSPAPESSLDDPGGMAAEFIKNTKIWRVVRVNTVDGVLGSEVCSYSRREQVPEPYNCTPLAVTQVNATTYRVVVKVKQVKKAAKVLAWTAGTITYDGIEPLVDVMRANNKPFRWRL